MKISKEIKTGVIALAAIGLLIAGVNFLKGNSFFGGDDYYYAYFPNSGGIAPASSVILNGVGIGKILEVENVMSKSPDKKVRIKFSIQNEKIKISKGSSIEIGPLDLFSKGLILTLNPDISKGFYKRKDSMMGSVAVDMFTQVKAYADPVTARLQGMMEKVDKLVASFSAFWDTTATTELQGSMSELKIAINRFSNVASQVDELITEEKQKFGNIMSNVESISTNLKRSNDEIGHILGNAKKLTDDLVTSDFKNVIGDAHHVIKKLNSVMDVVEKGEGTLGKLVKDDVLFNELVKSNKDLQNLVIDLQIHPERYIHFSLIGRKNKGLELNPGEEKKLHELLDTTINNK